MPGIAEHEIPWNFGDQCKEKQVLTVFFAVPCMQEPFNKKKTEDREGRPSDVTDDAVPGNLCGTNCKKYPEGRLTVGEDQDSGMVDQHQDAGKKFQGAAA